ncbi:ribonuclease HI [Acetobacteraceae bacterium]|nr:ribonuclease HI [Acetobacteraceae bacterium]
MSEKKIQKVEIWTDGGCRPNPGPGGWGVLLKYGETEKELWGGESETTNNRMELTAAIKALEALKRPCEITLHTDSSYVKNGITKWLKGWIAKGWKTASKKPVLNQDLWEKLNEEVFRHRIQWKWVKGHAGDEGNERADVLATRGIEEITQKN